MSPCAGIYRTNLAAAGGMPTSPELIRMEVAITQTDFNIRLKQVPTVEAHGDRCRQKTISPPKSLKIVFPSPAFCYYFRLPGPFLPLFSPFWIFFSL